MLCVSVCLNYEKPFSLKTHTNIRDCRVSLHKWDLARSKLSFEVGLSAIRPFHGTKKLRASDNYYGKKKCVTKKIARPCASRTGR